MIIKRYIYLLLCITQIYFLSASEGVDASTKEAESSKEENLEEAIAQLSGKSEASTKRKRRKKNKDKSSKYPNSETVFLVSTVFLTALSYNSVKPSDTVVSPTNTTVIYKLLPENSPPVSVNVQAEPELLYKDEQSENDSIASTSDKETEVEPERGTHIIVTPPNDINNPHTNKTTRPPQNNTLHQPISPYQSMESNLSSDTEREVGTTAGGHAYDFNQQIPTATAPVEIASDESLEEEPNKINIVPSYNLFSDTDAYDGDKSEDTDAENKISRREKIKGFLHINKKKKLAENVNPDKAREEVKPAENSNLNKFKKKIKDYGSDVGNDIIKDMKSKKKSLAKFKGYKSIGKSLGKKIKKLRNKNNEQKEQLGEASVSQADISDEEISNNGNNEDKGVSDHMQVDI